jgi:hypothetical protein
MIVIIQCAAGKRPNAPCLKGEHGRPVRFVADPASAPVDGTQAYARPDDLSCSGKPWREVLWEYNNGTLNNPLGLFSAYRLYQNRIYARLVDRLGPKNIYILSAGWGLIAADFLTPDYDITFSQSAERFKRRLKGDRYLDYCMLSDRIDEEIVFFGGKDYIPLLCSLTQGRGRSRRLFYNSVHPPQAPGWILERFATSTRTNWHYECAAAFLESV